MSDRPDENDKALENQKDNSLIEDLRPGEDSGESQWEAGDPLPHADKAEIDQNKFERYSMDPANEKNQGKWKAFEELGYDVRNESGRRAGAQHVTTQLRENLPNSSAVEGKESPYGSRYEVRSNIRGLNGKEGTLVSVWQIDRGSENPRMITNWLEVHRQKE